MKAIFSTPSLLQTNKCMLNLVVSVCLLVAIVVFNLSASAQSKIDSLELQLTKDLTREEQIRTEIDLLFEYLNFRPQNSSQSVELLSFKLDSTSNTKFLVLFNLAKSIHFRQAGNFELAKQSAFEALDYANTLSDSIVIKAKIYNSLGAIADGESNIQVAIKYQLIALRYAEQQGDPDLLATTLGGIGKAYEYLSEYSIAKKYLTKAILLKENSNQFDSRLAANYTNLSNCFDAEGSYDSSIYFLDKAIELNKKNHNKIDLITTYNNKAYTLFLKGSLHKAETIVLIALALADSLDAELETMFPYSTYAEILFAQNKLSKADKMMQKSIELSKKYNDLYLAQYNLDLLYNIHLKSKDYKQALEYFKQKSVVIDSIYNVASRKEIERLALEYETEKKNKEIELLNQEKRINSIELIRSKQLVIAFIVTTLLMIVVIFLLRKAQKSKIKTTKLLDEAKEKVFEQKLADSEIQALRAQMNPHFLFNCLNSINSFIIKNDQERASEYLAKFSKLIRQVLNNSKSSKVTLANELEALELYIEMEALRFSNKFEYQILVDPAIEKDYLEIPPLIIQPYVENSIWHGLMHKKEGVGTLLVDIKKKNDLLICTIQDNGIGRNAAFEIKSKSAVKRKSFGMNITKERLNYINQKFKNATKIEVIDLLDDKDIAIGTRVVIKIGIA